MKESCTAVYFWCMRKSSVVIFTLLCLATVMLAIVGYALAAEERRGLLTVAFLDVGQGDATFIDAPSGRQVLIDGGPGSAVLPVLARVMPWYDRSIDIVVATHPDADHIEGLIDVLERYDVGVVVVSSVQGETALSEVFARAVKGERARVILAMRGDVLDLGHGSALEILFPDRPVSGLETNVGCVVLRLTYGETAFMLPCDAPDEIETYLTRLDGARLHSDVLKAAHHGSKTSSASAFVGAVSPEYAVYSRGCGNSYGHPHQETIHTFARFDIPTLDTCEERTITFVSDGQTVRRR